MPKARDLPEVEKDENPVAGAPAVDTYPQCAHVNRHFINSDQEQDELSCTLPAGHGGDHSASYKCLRQRDGSARQARSIAKGEVLAIEMNGKQYVETLEIGFWSDGASTPADKIKPDLEQLRRMKMTKGDMLDAAQILTKELAAQQAAQRAQGM